MNKKLEKILDGLADQIKFIKGQQWQTAYYSILCYVAFIMLFQLDICFSKLIFNIIWIIVTIILLIISLLFVLHQLRHRNALIDYREKIDVAQKLLVKNDNNNIDFIINSRTRARYRIIRYKRKNYNKIIKFIVNLFYPIPSSEKNNKIGDFKANDKRIVEKVFQLSFTIFPLIAYSITLIIIWFDPICNN